MTSIDGISVSVIIPVYNAEKYLRKCLGSLENQSCQSFEVLIVNDGSTDSSQKIIDEYVSKYPDKYRSFIKENGGQSSARNLALPYAGGEYITFLDSDDYYDEKYLETLYSAAKENNSDMVISGQKKVDEEGKVYLSIDYKVDKYPKTVLRRLNFSGKMYRTEYMRKHNMKFAVGKTYEDNPFNFIMIFLAKNLVILPYSGYYQVGHPGSTTTKKIDSSKIPYEALEYAIKNVCENKELCNDYSVFEYTVMSFFTYFIFKANKSHSYLAQGKQRKSECSVVLEFCDFSLNMLNKYMPQYYKNKHLSLWKNRDLQFKQRVGTWGYSVMSRMKLLKVIVKVYYKF